MSEFSRIEEELAKMKENEIRHVRLKKGPQGLMTIQKKKKKDPFEEFNQPKQRARVITRTRGVAPAQYD